MFRKLLILLLALVPAIVIAAPVQRVGALQLQYSHPFRLNPDRARAIMAGQDRVLANQYQSVEVFDAPGDGNLRDIGVTRLIFGQGVRYDLDGAARGTVSSLERLSGATNPRSTIRPAKVSGLDARRISFSMDRMGGKVGCEGLVILDRRANTAWIVQTVFGKEKPLLPFTSLNIEDQRAAATTILDSASIVGAQ